MTPFVRADGDKPHRCPICWRCLTWGTRMRRFRYYKCKGCGQRVIRTRLRPSEEVT